MRDIRKFLDLSSDQAELKLDKSGPEGTFEGYASRFGAVDSAGDTIMKGAFTSTLRANPHPKLFANHKWDVPIGRLVKAHEDDSGLFVKGQLTPGHSQANDIYAALKHGTMDGLSIGGFIKKGDAVDKEDGRGQVINKFSRLVEVSIVPFPADGGARIDASTLRGEDFDLMADMADATSERDFERVLRDVGLSKAEAMTFLSRLKAMRSGAGDPPTKKAADPIEDEFLKRFARIGALAL